MTGPAGDGDSAPMNLTPTPEEQAGLAVLLPELDCRLVRLYRGDETGWRRAVRRLVLWAGGGRAVTLGNQVFLPARWARDPAVVAHELTHCGQYQAWGRWVYFARGAAAQARYLIHRTTGWCESPYRYRIQPGKPFEEYGMEEQAQMVEDWVRAPLGSPPLTPRRPPGRPDRPPPSPVAGLPIAPTRSHPGRPPSP